ncbi:hypothetical protein TrRE_jg4953 [Triparma retinervis]|uniref:Gamma-butyrobetaine hydroxylase-like N-terminal domain-containing protein n=1 Tax=Triparma retinervis TaxID=2557542 RepID=A0A9W7ATF6_9STRA|nr:hypothetical protein TrRE_jg4953 [Triparma retinervis]
MTKVKNIVAVSSCKGGVGKSTTTVNLAFTLQSLGYTVGIFDADIYGPSLPVMLPPTSDAVSFVGTQISPLSSSGIKLMSFGYINGSGATMRGPMLNSVLKQFIGITSWGDLDYLLLDMPPGTGDVQLTLCQEVDVTAALIVGSPSEVAWADVERGIGMFEGVEWGIDNFWKIPRRGDIAAMGDGGEAFVRGEGVGGEITRGVYRDIGECVARECDKIKSGGNHLGLSIEYWSSTSSVTIKDSSGDVVGSVGGKALRGECGCAECVEEMTGRKKVVMESIEEDVRPVRTGKVGNYGMEVEWSDGHRSLYPYKQLRAIVAEEGK